MPFVFLILKKVLRKQRLWRSVLQDFNPINLIYFLHEETGCPGRDLDRNVSNRRIKAKKECISPAIF